MRPAATFWSISRERATDHARTGKAPCMNPRLTAFAFIAAIFTSTPAASAQSHTARAVFSHSNTANRCDLDSENSGGASYPSAPPVLPLASGSITAAIRDAHESPNNTRSFPMPAQQLYRFSSLILNEPPIGPKILGVCPARIWFQDRVALRSPQFRGRLLCTELFIRRA